MRPLRSSGSPSRAPRLHLALGQRIGRLGALGQRQRHQHALDGDEGIARLLGDGFGLVENARRFGRHVDLARALALDLGLLGEVGLDRAMHRPRNRRPPTRSGWPQGLPVVEQDFQDGRERAADGLRAAPASGRFAGSPACARCISLVSSLYPFIRAPVMRRAKERTLSRGILCRYGEGSGPCKTRPHVRLFRGSRRAMTIVNRT